MALMEAHFPPIDVNKKNDWCIDKCMCSDNFLCEEYICMHQTNGHKKEH